MVVIFKGAECMGLFGIMWKGAVYIHALSQIHMMENRDIWYRQLKLESFTAEKLYLDYIKEVFIEKREISKNCTMFMYRVDPHYFYLLCHWMNLYFRFDRLLQLPLVYKYDLIIIKSDGYFLNKYII